MQVDANTKIKQPKARKTLKLTLIDKQVLKQNH